MTKWKELIQDSKLRWDANAEHWDDYMGEESNRFHRELIRPYTEQLLDIKKGQTILDIACGNGNFSRRLADLGANVVAFDYSKKMVERAKQRSNHYSIQYEVKDATNYEELLKLGSDKYDCAVANMALMDIADIHPLVHALQRLLKSDGTFVFSITHPSFQPPGVRKVHETEDVNGKIITKNSLQISKYLTPESYQAIGIKGQSIPHFMFHRSLSDYMNTFFKSGFVMDGIEEPSFRKHGDNISFEWHEIPPVIILRFRKLTK